MQYRCRICKEVIASFPVSSYAPRDGVVEAEQVEVARAEEVTAPTTTVQYAGFRKRLCAAFLDGWVTSIATFAIAFVLGLMIGLQ